MGQCCAPSTEAKREKDAHEEEMQDQLYAHRPKVQEGREGPPHLLTRRRWSGVAATAFRREEDEETHLQITERCLPREIEMIDRNRSALL